ncbi:hypothetical protein D9M73_247840 [compost metagenome]
MTGRKVIHIKRIPTARCSIVQLLLDLDVLVMQVPVRAHGVVVLNIEHTLIPVTEPKFIEPGIGR